MEISHHLDDATIVAYAAGTLPRTLSFVVESHLEFCPACRTSVRLANEVGASISYSSVDPVAVSENCKNSVLNQIGSATVHRLPVTAAQKRGDVPVSLQRLLKIESLDEIPWRKSAPGIQLYKLPKQAGEEGFFGMLKIAPGFKVPEHSHGGTELTVILKGAYEDELGRFGRGDIADHDESVEHSPTVINDEYCICLVANHAATRFRSWPARMMQRFIRI